MPLQKLDKVERPEREDIQNMLKTPQWVRVQGVFLRSTLSTFIGDRLYRSGKKPYPVCVEFYFLVTTPRPRVYSEEGAPNGAIDSTALTHGLFLR